MAVRREKEEELKGMATLFEMYDYFCYVLTDALTPWQAHKEYGQRAVAETWIEEAKNQTALAQIKKKKCAILAYNTLRYGPL